MNTKTNRDYRASIRAEFQPRQILPNLTAGVLIGFTEIIFAVSLGSLLFSGDLAPHLPQGITIAIASLAITTIIISLTSSVPGIVTGIQENPAIIQAVIIAGIWGTLSIPGDSDRLSTSLGVLLLTCLLTGVFLLVLGLCKLGEFIRYIPFPVIGGFLAGTGWLLVQASFDVMTGYPLTLENIPFLLELDQILIWLPGSVLAVVLIQGIKRVDHIFTLPGIVIAAISLFYFILLVTGTSIEAAISRGLLLGEIPEYTSWQPIGFQILKNANWQAVLGQSGNIASILVLSVLTLLLNATGLELAIQRDININHELRAAGIANIFSSLGGGMVGFQALSETALSHRLGARGRLMGLVAGLVCVGALFAGVSAMKFIPKMLVGGLLLFLGLDFLAKWVIGSWSKLSRSDYLIILLILFGIATTNFLTGFGIGLLAMMLMFIVNYSQINVVHHMLSGVERRSNLERPEEQWEALRALGGQVLILELQGYLFFGTAHNLLGRIRERVNKDNLPPIRFIILDCHRVSGMDSSAAFSFIKCRQVADCKDITVIFTGFPKKFQNKLRMGDLFGGGNHFQIYPDLDHALEWCENRLLEQAGFPTVVPPKTLGERLVDQGFPRHKLNDFLSTLECIQLRESEYLIRQGEEAIDLYLIESGRLSVYLEMENRERIRLQTLSMRTMVGELGLYTGFKRTASIIAEENCVVYRLSRDAVAQITRQDAELAAAIHAFIAGLLARRLADTTELLAALDQ